MARIRTIKPEFWDSPSTAKAGPWARLLFIALWNWADDHGRGTANLKELEGFAFPNDTFPMTCSGNTAHSHGNTVHFRDVVAEVSECFGVVFYTVSGRPYFEIPSWDAHQRNERRSSGSKYPGPAEMDFVAETPCNDTETPRISAPGTGEQGNRGTGESLLTLVSNQQTAPARAKDGAALARQQFADLNTAAHSAQAHSIAVAFSRSQAVPIEHRDLSNIATQIDSCLAAGIPVEAIAAGLDAWQNSDSWAPSQIPSFVRTANRPKKSTSTKRAEVLDDLKEK